MTFLSTAELSQLRDDLDDLMPDSCAILRRTFTNDKGHMTESLGTAVVSVACRVDPLKRMADAGLVADQEKGTTFWQVTLPYDTDILDGDELRWNGDTLRMIALHNDHSAKACKRAIMARKGS
jgi:hypothetical protein